MVIAFVVWSYSLFEWGLIQQQSSPVFKIPMVFSQSAMFVASVLILFYTVRVPQSHSRVVWPHLILKKKFYVVWQEGV